MTWAAAAFLVLAFFWILHLAGVPRRAADVVTRARAAFGVVRDQEMSDLDKEAAVQAHSKALFGQFLVITASAALALAAPTAVVAGLSWLDFVDFEAVLDHTMSWPMLAFATAGGLVMWRLLRSPR